MTPLFSVIIPTYNRLSLLKEALESVWAQTYKDYEVIVVDDGSSDGTLAWLESAADRLKFIAQSNRGPGPARNAAASIATGRYLTFLDDDDLWYPWTLSVYAEALQADGGGASFIAGTKGTQPPVPGVIKSDLTVVMRRFPDMLSACDGVTPPLAGTPSVSVDRSVFHRVGGFLDHFPNAEDLDLWFRLGAERHFVRIQSPPVFFQRYQAVSAHKRLDAEFEGVKMVLKRESLGIYPGAKRATPARQRIIAAMARSVSLALLRNNYRREAWDLYSQSLGMQLRLLRFRYVLGFPIMCASDRLLSIK